MLGELVAGEVEAAVVAVAGLDDVVWDGLVGNEGDMAGVEVEVAVVVGVFDAADLLNRRLPLVDVENSDLAEAEGAPGVGVAGTTVDCLSVLLRRAVLLASGRSTSGTSSSTSPSLSDVGPVGRGVDDGSWLGLVNVSSFRACAALSDGGGGAAALGGWSSTVTSSSSSLSCMRCLFRASVSFLPFLLPSEWPSLALVPVFASQLLSAVGSECVAVVLCYCHWLVCSHLLVHSQRFPTLAADFDSAVTRLARRSWIEALPVRTLSAAKRQSPARNQHMCEQQQQQHHRYTAVGWREQGARRTLLHCRHENRSPMMGPVPHATHAGLLTSQTQSRGPFVTFVND